MALPSPAPSPNPIKNRNTYFVDTKTHCFLCLRRIQIGPPPVITLDKEENAEEVDEGTSQPTKEEVDTQEEMKRQQFCLRSIYKLIKIDPGKVVSRTLSGGSLLDSKLLDTDLTVLLCGECIKVTEQLSSLCLELEIAQMKVNDALRGFKSVLQNSRKDPVGRLAQFRSKITDPLVLLHVSLADRMRKETENKCQEYLKTSAVLKVDLSVDNISFNVSPSTVPSPPPQILSTEGSPTGDSTNNSLLPALSVEETQKIFKPARVKCKICECPFTNEIGLDCHMRRKHSAPPPEIAEPTPASEHHTCNGCGIKLLSKIGWIRHTTLFCSFRKGFTKPPPPPPPVVIPAPTPVVTSSVKVVDMTPSPADALEKMMYPLPLVRLGKFVICCGLCPFSSAIKFHNEERLRIHILTSHPHHIFSSIKAPDCSDLQFEEICKQVLDTVPTNFSSSSFSCPFCSSSFHDRESLTVHYFQLHFSLFSSKISVHQNTVLCKNFLPCARVEPLGKTPEGNQQPKKCNRAGRFECPHCGIFFRHTTSLARHVKVQHSRTSAISVNPPPQDEKYKFFCEYCNRGFSAESYRHFHMKKSPCGILAQQRETGKLKTSTPVPMKSVACQYCGKVLSCTSALYRHHRQNCSRTHPTAAEAVVENVEALEGVEEEVMDIEVNPESGSYLHSKVEVLEMGHLVNVYQGGDGENLNMENGAGYDDNIFLDSLEEEPQDEGEVFMADEKDPSLMDMILPDTEDPLMF